MKDLSLHILDIAENAIRAGANKIMIELIEDKKNDLLSLTIKDNGIGMDEEMVKMVLDPFFTTKDGKETGLGLSLLAQAAKQASGDLTIDSRKKEGTKVTATFQLSHPDTKPMGDIMATMTTLIAANPSTQFILDCKQGNDSCHFDSFEIFK